jgi:hypothetical protein
MRPFPSKRLFSNSSHFRVSLWTQKMGWHVRYIYNSLKHDMLSREWSTEDEALEEAWNWRRGITRMKGSSRWMKYLYGSKNEHRPKNALGKRDLRPEEVASCQRTDGFILRLRAAE